MSLLLLFAGSGEAVPSGEPDIVDVYILELEDTVYIVELEDTVYIEESD